MLRAVVACALLVAVVLAAPGDSVFDDANGDLISYCPVPANDYGGHGGLVKTCGLVPNAYVEPVQKLRYGVPPGGARTAPAIGIEYDEWSANEAHGSGFRIQLDYVAEVGPSDTTVVKKIFGTPTCDGDAYSGDLEPTYATASEYLPYGCGEKDWPWGNGFVQTGSNDAWQDCANQFGGDDGWMNFEGGAKVDANVTFCEDHGWTNFGQSVAVWRRSDQSFENYRRSAEGEQATVREEITTDNLWKEEYGRIEVQAAVYDWPVADPSNRYNFRYRFERVNMDGPDGVSTCENWHDWNGSEQCLVLRGEPKGDGFECRRDGPPVDGPGGDDGCLANPQIRVASYQLRNGAGAYPQLEQDKLSWLYGDPAVRHTFHNSGGYDMYSSAACSCDDSATANRAEVSWEEDATDKNVWYLNYVVPATPDCTGTCWNDGTDHPMQQPRGVIVKPFAVWYDAGSTASVSAMLVAAATALVVLVA